MTGTVENAKVVAPASSKSIGSADASPVDLLKKAVGGQAETPASVAAKTKISRWSPADTRLAAVAAVALALGTSFGMIAAPRERTGDALAHINVELESGRGEITRLNSEIERVSKAVVSLREMADSASVVGRSVAPKVNERVGRLEEALDKKLAALVERLPHADRDQSPPVASSATAADKQAATVTPVASASTSRTDPIQTGSIAPPKAETKPKSEMVEAWALRDVYQGIAMLEDRKRRLVEVAPGDTVPGIGRVESIERRGRNWVVVTRQGLITPQTW